MPDSTTTVDTTTTTEDTTVESVTMTQAELDALVQKEGDKRVAQALKTVERKNKEAERLRNMSAEDKAQYELTQRELAIEAKERELALAEMRTTASKVLLDKGISVELVDLVVNEDADVTNANIKLLDKAFKNSVKAEVEKRLGTKAPSKPATDPDAITKEQFSKMSLADKQRLFTEHRDIYNSLVGA